MGLWYNVSGYMCSVQVSVWPGGCMCLMMCSVWVGMVMRWPALLQGHLDDCSLSSAGSTDERRRMSGVTMDARLSSSTIGVRKARLRLRARATS